MGFRLPQWRQSGRHALQSLASMPREGGASTLSDICESLSLNRTIAVLCVQSISIGADSRWGRGGVEPPITGLRLRRRAAAERQRQQAADPDAPADRPDQRRPGVHRAGRARDAPPLEPYLPRTDPPLHGASRAPAAKAPQPPLEPDVSPRSGAAP